MVFRDLFSLERDLDLREVCFSLDLDRCLREEDLCSEVDDFFSLDLDRLRSECECFFLDRFLDLD